MIEGVIGSIASKIIEAYQEFIGFFPDYVGNFINFLVMVLLVVVYAVFVWKLYKFASKKDPLGLNLNQYNKIEHSFLARLVTGILYLIEYIIILPFLIFFWFAVFTFLLIILSQSQETSQILIVSAIIITTIRVTSYYREELSQDIAKVLPLTLLAVSVLNPNFFTEAQYLEKVLTHFTQIPIFIGAIMTYLIFIIIIESFLRFFDFVYSLFGGENPKGNLEKDKI